MARAKSSIGFRVLHDGVIKWFDGPEWDDVAEQEFEKSQEELEMTAKRNAPWTDRTGEARAGISSEVTNTKGEVAIRLFHTAEHGRWLELIQNGRFAIIMPTLESQARRITYNAIRRIRYARRGEN